jgi:phosphoribosylformylglycinamidine (FGAM) synthase-like amidotransferase family enzyme
MNNVIHLSKPVTFDVEVTHAIAQDADDRTMWVGVCDGLHVVTEAETYEGLVARVREIAPEMAQENGLSIAPEVLRLRFIHVESVPELLAM